MADLEAVSRIYHRLAEPPALEQVPIPADATAEQREAIESANHDHERDWKRETRRWKRTVERWREDVEEAFLDALTLVETERYSDRNIREPVNIRAARILGSTGNVDLAKRMQRSLERDILDARHEVSEKLIQEAFAGLARLGNPDTLAWLVDDYVHTRSTPRSAVDRLIAAHQAMLLFDPARVPGSLRHELVEQFVRMYAGVESVAKQGKADATSVRTKMFWDQIRDGVIQVLQRFSRYPEDTRGLSLATVEAFQQWFRDHKNPRQAPWTDE